MMMRSAVFLAVILASPAWAIDQAGSPSVVTADAKCTGLQRQNFSGAVGATVTIESSVSVAAGKDPRAADLPAYCQVTATIAPNNKVELRLPVAAWSGRVLMAGCGGLCGAIQMERTDDALIRGYAVAHTDMGHATEDMSFAEDPQALDDFVHRSTHVATVLLKSAAAAYYGRPHQYAYFRGCSTGGRQGLTAALLHADDYNGIIAGSPAAGAGAVPNITWAVKALFRADGSAILDVPAIETLHLGAIAACDLDDGAADGIVADPYSCDFDPGDMICRADVRGTCLTQEQVTAARSIYAGFQGDEVTPVRRGFPRGSESGWIGNLVTVDGQPGSMSGVARNYLRRFADQPDAPKTLAELDFNKYPVKLAPVDALPSFGNDGRGLAGFRDRGGKLLLHHSWADNSLSPATAIDVYEQNRAAFAPDEMAAFFRLFVIPGVRHCGGGTGPAAVDWLTAIERWVEQDQAPDQIVAARLTMTLDYPNEVRFPVEQRDIMSARPLFPYPAFARFSGTGNSRQPDNWIKVEPAR